MILLVIGLFCLANSHLVHDTLVFNGNFIANNDFSVPFLGQKDYKVVEGGFVGWQAVPNMEIGSGKIYNPKWFNGQALQLDADHNTIVSQKIYGLFLDQNCNLKFDYAPRVTTNAPVSSSEFWVWWNGDIVKKIIPTDDAVHILSIRLKARADRNTLAFIGRGVSDTYGAVIGNIVLNCQ